MAGCSRSSSLSLMKSIASRSRWTGVGEATLLRGAKNEWTRTPGSEPINQVNVAVIAEHPHGSARGPLARRNISAASVREGTSHDQFHHLAGRQEPRTNSSSADRSVSGDVVRACRRTRRHFHPQQSGFANALRLPLAETPAASPAPSAIADTDCCAELVVAVLSPGTGNFRLRLTQAPLQLLRGVDRRDSAG